MKKVRKFGQKGQSSVEYLLIIVVLVAAIFMFGKTFKEKLSEVTGTVFGSLGSKMKEQIEKSN